MIRIELEPDTLVELPPRPPVRRPATFAAYLRLRPAPVESEPLEVKIVLRPVSKPRGGDAVEARP